MSDGVTPRYCASGVARYSEMCAVLMAPYAIDAWIRNDHGSPSVNTTTGRLCSSERRLMKRRVERAGWPLMWTKEQLYLVSNSFSTNRAYIPPVSIATMNLVSTFLNLIFSFSTLYGML